ncbi:protein FAR1-RELATED SEQUENCE 5-like [Camellia sinensis]|uniref:protein FAR1-RELATED SEQUENCE 5-like n=1 Tax=Camellia sinensis TaxID=4442 RepID=UPI0010367A6B|nr:protein FAR1-RELATED SEQUENCE 5-like [Camellia sinensis]
MDIDSNNHSLNETEEVEEVENNPSLNEIGEVEELKMGMCFSSKQELHVLMDIDSNNHSLNETEEVEEVENNPSLNEIGEVEELKMGMCFSTKQERTLTPVKRRLEINDKAGIRVARNFHSIVVEAGGMQQQNLNFYSAIDLDEDGHMRNLFWADARSKTAYEAFGDVVSFDTTYLTNKYDMPFCFLFREWLSYISDAPSKAIITDQCRAMQNAIEVVFPQARHLYDCFTKGEFDEEWQAMIAKFNLDDNEWLGVLYNERHRWIPTYVKDVFWASMSTTQRSESMNAFFNGYVNSKTTLKQFVDQYDNALRTYTNAKFKEVQVELKRLLYCRANLVKDEGAICTYHVKEAVLVAEKMKTVEFVVYFNNFAYFNFNPFGAGRRGCPGFSFGVLIVEYVLANLLYWFDWKYPSGPVREEDFDMSEVTSLVVHKKIPLQLVPVLHSPSFIT